MERFKKFLDYIFEVEGGFTDDENDRGGATNFGITHDDAEKYLSYTGDMRDFKKSDAEKIYKKVYYCGNHIDKITDDRVALSIFDWAVNSGRNGTKNAQIAINQLTNANLDVDGIIGNKTLEAINSVDPEKFLQVYHNLQRIYYRAKVESDKTQEDFLTGWLNRVDRKEQYLKDWNKENIKTGNKKYSFSEQSLNMFKNVHPNLVKIMKAAIENSPYDFRITAGARTAEEQNKLYQQGRTTKGTIITKADGYKNKSNHQIKADGYGHAVDIFVCGKYDENGNYQKFNAEEGYDNKKIKEVANHIKAISKNLGLSIEWGGDWKFYDSPHFQV